MEMTAEEVARMFHSAAENLFDYVEEAEARSLEDVRDRMLFWTNGGESLADLRRADHPYARRHGRIQRHPVRINRQSGALQESLESVSPQMEDADTLTASAFFTAPHARYLFDAEASRYPDGGTEKMFGRDLPGQVLADTEDPRAARVEAALLSLF